MGTPMPPIDPAGPLAWLNDLAAPAPGPAPPQASDPVTYRGAITIPKAPTPAVGGGSFRVDRERAPEAIRDLEEALAKLKSLRWDAVSLGRVTPPAQDEVSRDAAQSLSVTATGGVGSLVQALDAGLQRLQTLINQMRSDLNNYDRSDGETSATFSTDVRP